MPLPKFLQSVLWSYDLAKMSPRNSKDRDLLITQVLNHGDMKQLNWLTKTYSRKEIENVVKKPQRGMWFRRILDYWLNILQIKLPQETYQKAILNVNPQF